MYVCMYVCMCVCMYWLDGWMVGWMGGWVDGWMDGCIYKPFLYACMYVCMCIWIYVCMCVKRCLLCIHGYTCKLSLWFSSLSGGDPATGMASSVVMPSGIWVSLPGLCTATEHRLKASFTGKVKAQLVVASGKMAKNVKNCATETICPGRHCGKLAGGGRFFVIREIQQNQCLVAGSEYGARGGTKMCTGVASPLKLAACRLQHADITGRNSSSNSSDRKLWWLESCWREGLGTRNVGSDTSATHHWLLTMQSYVMQVENLRALGLAIQAQFLLWAVNFVWIFMLKLLKWPRIQVGSAATHKAIVRALDGHGVHPKFCFAAFCHSETVFFVAIFQVSNRGVSQKAKDNYTEIFNQVPGAKIPGNRGRNSREIEKTSRTFRFEFPQMKLLMSTDIILYLVWYSLCTLHLWSAVKMIRRPFAISTTISNTDGQTPSSSREVARRTLVDMLHIAMDRRFTVGDDSNAYTSLYNKPSEPLC